MLLAISVQVNAHAAIAPALGVDGTPVRADVQRPSTASPCGTVNVASTLDTSTPVQAAADGTFTATATDFNAYVSSSPVYPDYTELTISPFCPVVLTDRGPSLLRLILLLKEKHLALL